MLVVPSPAAAETSAAVAAINRDRNFMALFGGLKERTSWIRSVGCILYGK